MMMYIVHQKKLLHTGKDYNLSLVIRHYTQLQVRRRHLCVMNLDRCVCLAGGGKGKRRKKDEGEGDGEGVNIREK